MDDGPSATVCCGSCGTPIQEVEPEGWWAGELDSMKQELEEMTCRAEAAEDAMRSQHDRMIEYKAEVREAERNAERKANEKNGRIADRLCAMTDVISLMDSLIQASGKPTAAELNTLNTIRQRGGLPPL